MAVRSESATLSDGCPSCHTPLTLDNGERLCPACGIVVETDVIEGFETEDRIPSSVALTHSADPIRTTQISYGYRDANGKPVHDKSFQYYLRHIDNEGRKKGRIDFRPAIYRTCQLMDLPRVVAELAIQRHLQMQAAGLCRGRTVETCAATAVTIVARDDLEPQIVFTFRDLGRKTGEPWNRVAGLYRKALTTLNVQSRPLRPEAFIRRAAAQLSVPQDLRDEALDLARRINDARPTSVGPASIAAATGWGVWWEHYHFTQSKFSRYFGITDVSLRNALRELRDDGWLPPSPLVPG